MAQGEMRGKVFVPEVGEPGNVAVPLHLLTCVLPLRGDQLVGFPPGEARMDSLLAMDVVDPFEIVTNAQALRNMQSMAKAASDVTFITVSDVHLDSTTVRTLGSHVSPHTTVSPPLLQTMEELRRLFSGFAGASPSSLVIILIGNFTSRPFGQGTLHRPKSCQPVSGRPPDDVASLCHSRGRPCRLHQAHAGAG